MWKISSVQDALAAAGQELGTSSWRLVGQDRIDDFADVTEDHQWIHVDVERAARESPYAATIAHGFLTLSLIPAMSKEVYRVMNAKMGINYGLNTVRFLGPVTPGTRIRLRSVLVEAGKVDDRTVTSRFGTASDARDARSQHSSQISSPALCSESLSECARLQLMPGQSSSRYIVDHRSVHGRLRESISPANYIMRYIFSCISRLSPRWPSVPNGLRAISVGDERIFNTRSRGCSAHRWLNSGDARCRGAAPLQCLPPRSRHRISAGRTGATPLSMPHQSMSPALLAAHNLAPMFARSSYFQEGRMRYR